MMPNLLSPMLVLPILKLPQCHCISFLTHNIGSLVLVTVTAQLLTSEVALKVCVWLWVWSRGNHCVSDRLREVFSQVYFGLQCKIGPCISNAITTYSGGLQIGNTCYFEISLIQLKMISP